MASLLNSLAQLGRSLPTKHLKHLLNRLFHMFFTHCECVSINKYKFHRISSLLASCFRIINGSCSSRLLVPIPVPFYSGVYRCDVSDGGHRTNASVVVDSRSQRVLVQPYNAAVRQVYYKWPLIGRYLKIVKRRVLKIFLKLGGPTSEVWIVVMELANLKILISQNVWWK